MDDVDWFDSQEQVDQLERRRNGPPAMQQYVDSYNGGFVPQNVWGLLSPEQRRAIGQRRPNQDLKTKRQNRRAKNNKWKRVIDRQLEAYRNDDVFIKIQPTKDSGNQGIPGNSPRRVPTNGNVSPPADNSSSSDDDSPRPLAPFTADDRQALERMKFRVVNANQEQNFPKHLWLIAILMIFLSFIVPYIFENVEPHHDLTMVDRAVTKTIFLTKILLIPLTLFVFIMSVLSYRRVWYHEFEVERVYAPQVGYSIMDHRNDVQLRGELKHDDYIHADFKIKEICAHRIDFCGEWTVRTEVLEQRACKLSAELFLQILNPRNNLIGEKFSDVMSRLKMSAAVNTSINLDAKALLYFRDFINDTIEFAHGYYMSKHQVQQRTQVFLRDPLMWDAWSDMDIERMKSLYLNYHKQKLHSLDLIHSLSKILIVVLLMLFLLDVIYSALLSQRLILIAQKAHQRESREEQVVKHLEYLDSIEENSEDLSASLLESTLRLFLETETSFQTSSDGYKRDPTKRGERISYERSTNIPKHIYQTIRFQESGMTETVPQTEPTKITWTKSEEEGSETLLA